MYSTDLAHIHHAGFGDLARHAAPEVIRILHGHAIRSGRIVELGCGSGILASRLVAVGYRVTGLDASPAMIAIARRQVSDARFRIASIATAAIPAADAVVAIGEIISYLGSRRTVERLFRRVRAALRPGGVFIFDFIQSGERRTFPPRSRAGDDWALVARADLSADGRVLTRDLTTFRKIHGGYRRSREVHRVRIYPRQQIAAALAGAGFQVRMRRS